jgi:predicted nuclease of predicted toxin-antitoxin system
MSPQHSKPKVLLDENMPPRQKLPRTNHRFDVKHVALDLHKTGISDEEVYDFACKEKRLIITANYNDFLKHVDKSARSGIIGVSPNLSVEQIDKKLISKLIRSKNLFGKFTYISGDS